jgi:NADPH:quinone reductase-like Zn-dependent oxidoreductase
MRIKRVFKWLGGAVGVVVLIGVVLLLIGYARSTNRCYDGSATAPSRPMKAVVYCDYGSPDVLKIETIEKPVPGDSQVLIKVQVAAINPLDWHFMRGEPRIARFGMGLRRPSDTRLGVDFAGVVEAVGKSVTLFQPGDSVFGGRTGALAEYVTVRENGGIARKPSNLTLEQAATMPVAALTALQGLRDVGRVQAGQKVLINGASGGVGTFAVQIAKTYGAQVTGVSSTRNVELVTSIGADQVIDYTKEDFTTGAERYDLILDNVGNHSLRKLKRVLKPGGTYVMIGGPSGKWVSPLTRVFWMMLNSKFSDQKLRFFISDLTRQDLVVLSDLVQTGKVTPVIDRRYPLSQISDAMAYLETGRARGKVLVTME